MQPHGTYQKLVFSALCIALYIVVMTATQSFAFGQYQIRIATALYGLASLFPFLSVPLSLANVISNTLMGGLGLPDMIGGFLVGLATTGSIVFGRRRGFGRWVIWAAVTFIPGLSVPIWLSLLLDIPYSVLAASLLVGQCVCGLASVLLVTALEGVGLQKTVWTGGHES